MIKKRYGFTLMETLITIAIFSIVTSVIYLFFMVGVDSWEIGTWRTELQSQMRRAMDEVVDELKLTTRTRNPAWAISIQSQNDPNDTIVFYLPIIDSATGNITGWNGPISYTREIEAASNIPKLVRYEGNERRVLATYVDSVQFIDAGVDGLLYLDEVNIILTLQKTTPKGRTMTHATQGTAKLRN